ncbi:MAG: aromatic amino acid lyase [Rhodovibrionaceae bacterium]
MTLSLASRKDFTLENYKRVAWEGQQVAFDQAALARMAECRQAFERLIEDPEITIYGVTSGYGQMAKVRLSPEDRKRHANRPPLTAMTSFGEPLPARVVRGMVFARLTNFIEGHSAITPRVAESVAAMLCGGALPPVPALGNGCPGEILALSHLFSPLGATETFAEKDMLSLINGSPCATALVSDATLAAKARFELAIQVFALSSEALKIPLTHFDPDLEGLWADPHETVALRGLRSAMEGGVSEGRRPYQAPVSWRILPRVLGQASRAIAQAQEVAEISLESITDNPVYLPPDAENPNGRCFSTGGYHNAKAYPALDNLAAAWADLTLLCDRQTTKLLDGDISLLPPQLRVGDDGYVGTVGFSVLGYAEQARQAAQRSFLPGSEGGGFGQNDVAVPTFLSWRKEAEAGLCLEAGLACLAAIASQAYYVTEREAPPALKDLLAEVRDYLPPVTEARGLGPELERLAGAFARRVYADCSVD